MTRTPRPPLMSHEDRLALIRRPLPAFYTYPPAQRYGGVTVIDDDTWIRSVRSWNSRKQTICLTALERRLLLGPIPLSSQEDDD